MMWIIELTLYVGENIARVLIFLLVEVMIFLIKAYLKFVLGEEMLVG